MEIKYIEDYYDKVKEKYPELTEKQISRILTYGFQSYYLHTLYGGDILSMSPYLTVYCGKAFIDPDKSKYYRAIKKAIQIRVRYNKSRTQWDGYYYFGLTDEEFKYYESQIKKSGRRRQKFHFKKIILHKLLDELLITKRYNHIFKIPYPLNVGFLHIREDVITRNFEYILRRNKDGKMEPVSYE